MDREDISIEELKEILQIHLVKPNGTLNQKRFHHNWWTKNDMEYVYFAIEKYKAEYGITHMTQFLYHLFYDIKEIPLCEVCNINQKSWYTYTKGYRPVCSFACSANHPKTKQSRIETCIKKYGYDHSFKSEIVQEKRRQTFIKKYGADNPSKNADIQRKKIETSLNKYGKEYSQQKHFSDDTILKLNDEQYLKRQILELNVPLYKIAEELGVSIPTIAKALKNFNIIVPSTEQKRRNKEKLKNSRKETLLHDISDFPLLQDKNWLEEHISKFKIWELSKHIDISAEKILYWCKKYNLIKDFYISDIYDHVDGIYTIYKATNLINGKCYIGFTSNFYDRVLDHRKTSENKNTDKYYKVFYCAIRKYGWYNFHWEILYQSKDKDHCLNEMEPFYIKEYNSYIYFEGTNGYNMTVGGSGGGVGTIRPKKSKIPVD